MASMFTVTSSLQKAVTLINGLDTAKFPLLLARILHKLHIKEEHAFSAEEEEKLQGAFGLSEAELLLAIETCEFFLHQAAYHSAKPAVLGQQLSALELEQRKVDAIISVWQDSGKQVMDSLRHRSMAPKQLTDLQWQLNLQMAQATQSKLKTPSARLQLHVKDDNTQTTEKVKMEFSHEELYAFYDKLETIQSQLDGLT